MRSKPLAGGETDRFDEFFPLDINQRFP